MTVRAVVFDIGNVLIEWNPERLFDKLIGSDRRQQLFAEVPLEEMNLDIDRGRPFSETVTGTAEAHPDWHDEIMLWHDRWIEMASPAIDHSVRLFRALRANRVPVLSLSNFGVDSFATAAAHYPFLGEFDAHYISGHLGKIKPEPGIYAALEAGENLQGEALLFTDDRPANIAAAQARGWRTHLFESPDGWAKRLIAEGLLSKEEAV